MPARLPETNETQPLTQRLLWMLLLPSGFYLAAFALLTTPPSGASPPTTSQTAMTAC